MDEVEQNPAKYDLIFVDNNMRIMKGIEATKNIEEHGYVNSIKGLTVNLSVEDVGRRVHTKWCKSHGKTCQFQYSKAVV